MASRLQGKDNSEIAEHILLKNYTKVLVIVTGGTLTMVNTDQGYVSRAGLAERLKQQIVFYDAQHAHDVNLPEDWLVTP